MDKQEIDNNPSDVQGIVSFYRDQISGEEFKNLYHCVPFEHDKDACIALKQYALRVDREISERKISAGRLMKDIAYQYHTTTKEMKKHWRCIKK